MDWSKAKTIIIVAFIITNILLVYIILGQDSVKDPTLTDSFIEKSKALLEESNIHLDVDIPKTIPKLNTITVNYEDMDVNSINKKFLDNNANIVVEEDSTVLLYGDEKVVLDDRVLVYENFKEDIVYKNLDKEKVLKISKDFLLGKGYKVDDISKAYIREEDGLYTLEYSKVYNDVFIEKTYTRFKIDERGIRSFERLWLDVQDEGEKEIYIGTAPKAVLELLGREGFKDKVIVDISLCYFFDPNIENLLEEPVDSIEGRAVPAWRIEFDDGNKFIVDEY